MDRVLSAVEGRNSRSKREGGSRSEWLTRTNYGLSKLVTLACGLNFFGGCRAGLRFLYLTVNGWLSPPLCFPPLGKSLLPPVEHHEASTFFFFFFLLPKVCKQESRGLKPALQLYLSSLGSGRVQCLCLACIEPGGKHTLS